MPKEDQLTFELRHISVFVAVAEELSFRRAALRLGVAQPAVSRLIAELEDRLAVPLLRRTTRSVALTEPGRYFLDEARQILARVERTTAVSRGLASGAFGRLAVAYMSIAAHTVVPHVVQAYRRHHPDVALNLTYMGSEQQRDAVMRGAIDVGFVVGPFHSPEIDGRLVSRHRLVAIMPPGHRLADRAALTPADLVGEPLILGPRDDWGAFRRLVTEVFEAAGVVPHVALEATSITALFGLVASGLGIILFAGFPRQYDRAQFLPKPILTDRHPHLLTHVVWRRDTLNPAVGPFVETALRAAPELPTSDFDGP
jgi:DNA-binding transcriptional LysR family regulator